VLLAPEAMQMRSKLIRLADEKQVVYFEEEMVRRKLDKKRAWKLKRYLFQKCLASKRLQISIWIRCSAAFCGALVPSNSSVDN